MKSIEVKGTARTIAERSSEQARALKAYSVKQRCTLRTLWCR